MYKSVYSRIVITAGISLFSSYNVYKSWTDEQGIFEFERTNPKPTQGHSEETALETWKTACQTADLNLATKNPKRVSAEYSLLHALNKTNRLHRNPTVVLVHTDTLGGRASIYLLKRILENNFKIKVSINEVAAIHVEDRQKLRNSLGEFMETVAHALEQGDPSYTCFAPVGGYKVMTSLGYLAGAYMGFPTAYLHEDGQVLHEIPAVPIKISPDELRAMAPLIRRTSPDCLEWKELSDNEKIKVEQHPYLFERVDELVALNAFGRFIAKRPENFFLLAPKIQLSKEADKFIKDSKTRNYVIGQLKELLKKLESPESYWGKVRHDLDYDNLKNSTFFLYKGAVNGNLVFYVAYYHNVEDQILSINRIWTNHDDYIKDATKGNGFFDNRSQIAWFDRSSILEDAS